MSNPLRKTTVDMMMQNLEIFRQKAEEMENQHVHTMVEIIKDHASLGISDIDKFQESIDETMQTVDAAQATARRTTRRVARVYGTTKRSFY